MKQFTDCLIDFHKILVASLTKIQFRLKPEKNTKDNLYKHLHVLLLLPWDFFCGTKSLTQALSLLLLYLERDSGLELSSVVFRT